MWYIEVESSLKMYICNQTSFLSISWKLKYKHNR